MPNWCYQNLHIRGDYNERTRLIESVRTDKGHELTQLHPCPQELRDTISGWTNDPKVQAEREEQYAKNKAKYGYSSWYEWGNNEWDTKWGDCATELDEHDEGTTLFRFESAWSPAVALIRNISAQFPTLTFGLTYTEESNAFAGWTVFRNGVDVDSYDAEIPPYPDTDSMTAVELSQADDEWRDMAYELSEHGFFEFMAGELV